MGGGRFNVSVSNLEIPHAPMIRHLAPDDASGVPQTMPASTSSALRIGMIAAHIGIHDDQDNWRAARCIVNHNEVLGGADVQ